MSEIQINVYQMGDPPSAGYTGELSLLLDMKTEFPELAAANLRMLADRIDVGTAGWRIPVKDPVPAPTGGDLSAGARMALSKMREVLEEWIESDQRENRWHPDDIRRMIDDAARESGLPGDWWEAGR